MAIKFGITAANNLKEKALPEITRVEVRESLGSAITYTVTLAEDVCDGDFQLLADDAFGPCHQLTIWAEIDNKKIYLVKGPITGQNIKMTNGGQGTELQIHGSDNTIKMKLVERVANHEDETDKIIVSEIIQSYGLLDDVAEDKLRNDKEKHPKLQNQDDLSFVKQLASENGYYLWVTYDDSGTETVHVKALPLTQSAQAKLIINGDDDHLNNIDELSISWDADVPVTIVGEQLNAKTLKKIEAGLDQAPQPKLGKQSLIDVTDQCKQQIKATHKPSDDDGRAAQRSLAALNDSEWFIKASCATTYDRLCAVIHAHALVELVGAGSRHSGLYLVSGITHTIDVASYKMQIELQRNAWGPSPPPKPTGTGS